MTENGVQRWVDEFTRATNENEELQAHGKYYSCNFMLDMEEVAQRPRFRVPFAPVWASL